MRDSTTRTSASGRMRLVATLVLTTATIAMLSVLPTVQAQASAPAITLPPPGEVESVLGETRLGALPKEKLEEALGPLASHLEELLAGNPQAKLNEVLESTGVSEIIGKLLAGSPEPQTLIAQILQALNPERLQSLLGSLPTGEPPSKSTVEGLAHQLATTPEALAAQFGKTAEQLPATAMALTAPLRNGETLGVLGGPGGVTLGLIKGASETFGVTGGAGGPGASGTIVEPGATVTVHSAPAPSSGVKGVKFGKLRVISHRVRGKSATIVLEVPSAGTLAAGGKGVRSIRREAAKAERVTIHPSLTKAGTSSLRRHHRKLKVPVKISFKQVEGPSSAVTVALTYR